MSNFYSHYNYLTQTNTVWCSEWTKIFGCVCEEGWDLVWGRGGPRSLVKVWLWKFGCVPGCHLVLRWSVWVPAVVLWPWSVLQSVLPSLHTHASLFLQERTSNWQREGIKGEGKAWDSIIKSSLTDQYNPNIPKTGQYPLIKHPRGRTWISNVTMSTMIFHNAHINWTFTLWTFNYIN